MTSVDLFNKIKNYFPDRHLVEAQKEDYLPSIESTERLQKNDNCIKDTIDPTIEIEYLERNMFQNSFNKKLEYLHRIIKV
jgi:hypothetical protein